MRNRDTDLKDGLRLAALTTLEWLRLRMGGNAPAEWAALPAPSDYKTASDRCLKSQHINQGYVVDIVSLPDDGMWSLQITEPDLGSDPGNPDQNRPPVPGRIIETNVAFRIHNGVLLCGFRTMISDPEGISQEAEVYRLAPVRQLAQNPAFGLKQVTPLTPKATRITNAEQVKYLLSTWHSEDNQLPCVVFTQTVKQGLALDSYSNAFMPLTASGTPAAPMELDLSELALLASAMENEEPSSSKKGKKKKPRAIKVLMPMRKGFDPPYEVDKLARSTMAFCRTYLLEDTQLERFVKLSGVAARPGDIIVLYPDCFNGGSKILPLKGSKTRREETFSALRSEMMLYPRGKEVVFGHIAFLTAARDSLLERTDEVIHQSEDIDGEWRQRLEQQQGAWKESLAKKDAAYEALQSQLERQRSYQAQREHEMEQLRESHEAEVDALRRQLADQREDIAYLKRKLSQPKEHADIAQWAAEQFDGRILLHRRAVDLLSDRSARTTDVELICDALDFLATDYWDRRYLQISQEEMLKRCSEKYGRPFDICPTGSPSIEMFPEEYKIDYYKDAQGKGRESGLDYHLRVRNDSENLLRIYFLHDDAKRLIVIGSLPRHLRTAKIQ